MDMEKYRRTSSYYKYSDNPNSSDYIRSSLVEQAIAEFDLYLKYAPNKFDIYVNDNMTDVIIGTLQDVSDLEVGSDSKWLLTSLRNHIYAGDILTIEGKKWICTYDKEKNTKNCLKVKIQPCTFMAKIPMLKNDGTPFIYQAHSIITTYLTDMKELKQPFPTENGTSFMSVQFNEFTDRLKRQDRVWLYDMPYEIIGSDFTNINFYINKGYLKFTLKPAKKIEDLDNEELKICNYYNFFPKSVSTPNIDTTKLYLQVDKDSLSTLDKALITAMSVPMGDEVTFSFKGDSLGCYLTEITKTSCTINTSKKIGILYVQCNLKSDNSKIATIRIVIK